MHFRGLCDGDMPFLLPSQAMQYDPIKRSLGNVFNKSPFLRKLFYRLLDLLLLRAWHVHKELKTWIKQGPKNAQILANRSGWSGV